MRITVVSYHPIVDPQLHVAVEELNRTTIGPSFHIYRPALLEVGSRVGRDCPREEERRVNLGLRKHLNPAAEFVAKP